MTFVATVNGPETIWMVADRRLSYKGRPPKDDACKIMVLETTDAIAILGYAGLGATALGTEPADWMSAVLRGRNLPLENSLGVLADAIKRQLPEHIRHLPAPAHTVIATAFLRKEAKLYTIDLVLGPDRDKDAFRYTRHVFDKPASIPPRTPPVATAGSGGLYLSRNPENRRWVRDLLCLVRAHDRGRVSARVVADRLAAINNNVHLRISDKSVGPRCIVVALQEGRRSQNRRSTSVLHRHSSGLQLSRASDYLKWGRYTSSPDLVVAAAVGAPWGRGNRATVSERTRCRLPASRQSIRRKASLTRTIAAADRVREKHRLLPPTGFAAPVGKIGAANPRKLRCPEGF
jgi:hypothetical protein